MLESANKINIVTLGIISAKPNSLCEIYLYLFFENLIWKIILTCLSPTLHELWIDSSNFEHKHWHFHITVYLSIIYIYRILPFSYCIFIFSSIYLRHFHLSTCLSSSIVFTDWVEPTYLWEIIVCKTCRYHNIILWLAKSTIVKIQDSIWLNKFHLLLLWSQIC